MRFLHRSSLTSAVCQSAAGNPAQALEETEYIKVTRTPVQALLPTLKAMEAQGLVPFAGLYTLAVGLNLAAGV